MSNLVDRPSSRWSQSKIPTPPSTKWEHALGPLTQKFSTTLSHMTYIMHRSYKMQTQKDESVCNIMYSLNTHMWSEESIQYSRSIRFGVSHLIVSRLDLLNLTRSMARTEAWGTNLMNPLARTEAWGTNLMNPLACISFKEVKINLKYLLPYID